MKRKAFIACEYSGIVRDAFENTGWDAWSCDILPTESEQTRKSGKHLQGEIAVYNKRIHGISGDCVFLRMGIWCYLCRWHSGLNILKTKS